MRLTFGTSVSSILGAEDDARYIRHVDNEDGRNGSVSPEVLWKETYGQGLITCTFYLNDDWAEEDGGNIRLRRGVKTEEVFRSSAEVRAGSPADQSGRRSEDEPPRVSRHDRVALKIFKV